VTSPLPLLQVKLRVVCARDLDVVFHLAQMLAQYFPNPEDCITAIHELILNAIEHGNLGIGCEEKTAFVYAGTWREEIARRLSLPEYNKKIVTVTVIQEAEAHILTIADEGEGFAWQEYSELTIPSRKPNGRGLWIAFNSAFDAIQFNECGNEVRCVVRRSV
jgi:Histidine kinase-like ATPase domain